MPARNVTIVFIHSIAGSPDQWAPQVEHFRSDHDLVAVTLPGHAGADEPPSYAVETLADHVSDQLGSRERIVLVGHSGGALIAAHLAAANPDRVVGLLLVDPGTDGRAFPRERAEPMLAALRSEAYPRVAEEYWTGILDGASETTRARALADLRATARRALPGFLAAMQEYDAVEPIRRYASSHPVVAVATPLSDGPHALAAVSDRIEVMRVEQTSHWVQLDRPDVVNEALDRLLARVSRS